MTIPFPPIPPNSTRVILHASPVNLRVSRQLLRGELIGPILTRHAAARMSARLGGERERTGRAGLLSASEVGFSSNQKACQRGGRLLLAAELLMARPTRTLIPA